MLTCGNSILKIPGSATLKATKKGDPIIILNKTGDAEYDKMGGIKLYTNCDAITANNSIKGKWACVDNTANEQAGQHGLIVSNLIKITWNTIGSPIGAGVGAPTGLGAGVGTGGTNGVQPGGAIHYTAKPDFPFMYGNKNPKIQEIQACLGLDPTRYQTGNFGPITLAALQKITPPLDLTNGITQDIYNEIKTNHCSGAGNNVTGNNATGNNNTSNDNIGNNNAGNSGTIGQYNPQPTNEQNIAQGRNIFNSFKQQGLLRQSGNNGRIKYKGNALDPNDLAKVNAFLSYNGYTEDKDVGNKRYGEKYVWVKQQ